MTIVTKPIVAEKKDEKAFLEDVSVTQPLDNTQTASTPANADPLAVYTHPQQARRRTVRCLGLLLMAIGLLGCGAIIFRDMYRFSHRLRGICSLPINSRVLTDGTLISGSFIDRSGGKKELPEDDEETLVSILKKTVTEEDIVNENGGLRLEYEIDYEEEDFEITQMPQLSHGIYLHDFKVNKTMILDTDKNRCFIMDLDRTEIEPPRTLMEVIEQMNNGAYNLNMDEIRKEMRVVKPALGHLSIKEYGAIVPHCSERVSYKLIDITKSMTFPVVVKRSVDQPQKEFQFVEFGGKGFIKYNIVNMKEI